MSRKKDLNYFKKLNYNAILKKVEDSYYLFVPELSLIVKGTNINKTYKNLEKEKEAYFKKMIVVGAQEVINEPASLRIRKKIFADLILLFLKTVIIIFIFILIFFGSLPFFSRRISQLPNTAANLIFNYADRLTKLPPENKEKVRIKIKEMVGEIKPFTDELRVLWQDKN